MLEGEGTAEPCVLAWAEVHVRAIPEGTTQTCRVDVKLPADFPFEGNDSHYPKELAVSATEVSFRTDWDVQVRIPLPLPEVFVIEGPGGR
jgi:hypothetical protein